jgi:hypothetical protein
LRLGGLFTRKLQGGQDWRALADCGFGLDKVTRIANGQRGSAVSFYEYKAGSSCGRDTCPDYCKDPSALLAAIGAAAVHAGCNTLDATVRSMGISCNTGAAPNLPCDVILDGRVWVDPAGHGFGAQYAGHSFEKCGSRFYGGDASDESTDLDSGVPSFIESVIARCKAW